MPAQMLSCSQQLAKMHIGQATRQRVSVTAAKPSIRAYKLVTPRRAAVKTMAVAETAAPSAGSSATEQDSRILLVHSPQEFETLLQANKDKLVVLECKAVHCRPCKAFSKKYNYAANQYKDSLFVEIFGDETTETRNMMKKMSIKVTPTFVVFRNGEQVHAHGGVNEEKLHNAIQEHLQQGEAGFGTPQLLEPAATS